MKARERYFDFRRGLQTTAGPRRPDDFEVFQDVEVDRGGIAARKGSKRLLRVTSAVTIMDFDATNDRVLLPTDTRIVPMPTVWTLEMLFQVDSVAADRFVLGKSGATATGVTVKQTTTSTVVAVVTLSDATTVTLTWTSIAAGTVCGLQIVRDGTSLTGWLNGTTQTGTLGSATLAGPAGAACFGADNGAGWLDGGIDYCRLWSCARSTRQDLYRRLYNPRNRNVIADWVFTEGPQTSILDRSANNIHLRASGSPAMNRAELANNTAAIQGIGYGVRKSGRKELVFATHGQIHSAAVT